MLLSSRLLNHIAVTAIEYCTFQKSGVTFLKKKINMYLSDCFHRIISQKLIKVFEHFPLTFDRVGCKEIQRV